MNRIVPRKRFGQHFLVDERILDQIINSFSPRSDQLIVEIGPGTGILTSRLMDQVNQLTVIELDRDLAQLLKNNFDADRLNVIAQDVLTFDFNSLVPDHVGLKIQSKLRMVGNLPYNISTPLLFHLLQYVEIISDMVFMLQKEVALRLSATPGNKNYGRLSVMTGLELHCDSLFDVPPQAFDPPPKVDSTVVRLTPARAVGQISDRSRFNEIVKSGFSQRRKTLRNSLRQLVTAEQFELATIDSAARAENLSVEQFITLSNA